MGIHNVAVGSEETRRTAWELCRRRFEEARGRPALALLAEHRAWIERFAATLLGDQRTPSGDEIVAVVENNVASTVPNV